MNTSATNTRKVALVGYPGVQSLDLVGPFEVFSMANRFGDPRGYEVILASPEGGNIVCNSGLNLGGSVALRDLPDDLDTILVAGGSNDALRQVADEQVLKWLTDRAKTSRRIGSVCSGVSGSRHPGRSTCNDPLGLLR
jgi:transcriptional regulator GlxA family with amidase domain